MNHVMSVFVKVLPEKLPKSLAFVTGKSCPEGMFQLMATYKTDSHIRSQAHRYILTYSLLRISVTEGENNTDFTKLQQDYLCAGAVE